jgi:hypothetical protein
MKFIKTKANLPWYMLLEQTLALLVCPFVSRVATKLQSDYVLAKGGRVGGRVGGRMLAYLR